MHVSFHNGKEEEKDISVLWGAKGRGQGGSLLKFNKHSVFLTRHYRMHWLGIYLLWETEKREREIRLMVAYSILHLFAYFASCYLPFQSPQILKVLDITF